MSMKKPSVKEIDRAIECFEAEISRMENWINDRYVFEERYFTSEQRNDLESMRTAVAVMRDSRK